MHNNLSTNNAKAIEICEQVSSLLKHEKIKNSQLVTTKDENLIEKLKKVISEYDTKMQAVPESFIEQLKAFNLYLEYLSGEKILPHIRSDKIMERALFAIKQDYKKIRNYTQKLADINHKIDKANSNQMEIGRLLERGAKYKLSSGDKATIIKFYTLFITKAYCIREIVNNDLTAENYKEKLIKLQDAILGNRDVDIQTYFSILLKNLQKRRYSAEILLKGFTNHFSVQQHFLAFPSKLRKKISGYIKVSSCKEKHLRYFATLVFKLQTKDFKDLIVRNIDTDIFIKALYIQGLKLFKDDNENVGKKFRVLFHLLNERNKMQVFVKLINSDNALKTRELLTAIYGQSIERISDSLKDSINIRYCFSNVFSSFLNLKNGIDIKEIEKYSQLIFYISMSSVESYALNIDDKLHQLKAFFVKSNTNLSEIGELIEIYKLLPEVGSTSMRLVYAVQALKENNVQAFILGKILLSDEIEDSKKAEICLTLAGAFKLQLLKNTSSWPKLSGYNPRFAEYLKNPQVEADMLNEGFNIPYYFSGKLLTERKYQSDDKQQSLMFLLFNIFLDKHASNFIQDPAINEENFKKLTSTLEHVINFYRDKKYKIYRDKAIEYILDGLGSSRNEPLRERIEYAAPIIHNFTNYMLSHLDDINASNELSGENEIIAIFDKVMPRGDSSFKDWVARTSCIGDKIYFLYCYYKYSETDFDGDFKLINPDCNSESVFAIRNTIKDYLPENSHMFKTIGIDYFQHNQVWALSLIEYQLTTSSNIFMQIGTGQGKSLIIAETAKRVIVSNKAKQVFIITCYNHLAERDYNQYKSYYKHFGIGEAELVLCSKTSTASQLTKAKVIYADLETYFAALRNASYKSFTCEYNEEVYYPVKNNAVLIMDEFDSLVLDAGEINQRVGYFNIGKDVTDDKDGLMKILGKTFLEKCNQEFNALYDERWFNYIVKKEECSNGQKTTQNSLGQDITFADDFLSKLRRDKKASLEYLYLYPLSFYQQFNRVIGFSGSITRKGVERFTELFEPTVYYEIPPFFGTKKLKQNRIEEAELVRSDKQAYLQAIITDVEKRKDTQPILIFADSVKKTGENQSEYDHIKQALAEKFPAIKIYEVKTESDIERVMPWIGKEGSITLSTRIMARGADIKVDKSINAGLHLIISYYPRSESIYIQMLGRTARQDEKGSYSVIVRERENAQFQTSKKIAINAKADALHNCSQHFFSAAKKANHKLKNDLRWPLFLTMLRDVETGLDEKKQEKINGFVDKHILNI